MPHGQPAHASSNALPHASNSSTAAAHLQVVRRIVRRQEPALHVHDSPVAQLYKRGCCHEHGKRGDAGDDPVGLDEHAARGAGLCEVPASSLVGDGGGEGGGDVGGNPVGLNGHAALG